MYVGVSMYYMSGFLVYYTISNVEPTQLIY